MEKLQGLMYQKSDKLDGYFQENDHITFQNKCYTTLMHVVIFGREIAYLQMRVWRAPPRVKESW